MGPSLLLTILFATCVLAPVVPEGKLLESSAQGGSTIERTHTAVQNPSFEAPRGREYATDAIDTDLQINSLHQPPIFYPPFEAFQESANRADPNFQFKNVHGAESSQQAQSLNQHDTNLHLLAHTSENYNIALPGEKDKSIKLFGNIISERAMPKRKFESSLTQSFQKSEQQEKKIKTAFHHQILNPEDTNSPKEFLLFGVKIKPNLNFEEVALSKPEIENNIGSKKSPPNELNTQVLDHQSENTRPPTPGSAFASENTDSSSRISQATDFTDNPESGSSSTH
ncbi:hypothetical protein BY996DRAFT_6413437 [Phakopsora pachyrhizi]|nr:hypothetical protein BY996DRAFT_6413437 [Phakopsora pachyrhizi]